MNECHLTGLGHLYITKKNETYLVLIVELEALHVQGTKDTLV